MFLKNNHNKKQIKNMVTVNQQSGFSLVIALIVLLVITMISISAVRLSTQDIMIAANEQQMMLVSQASRSAGKKVSTFYNLVNWINNDTSPSSLTRQLNPSSVASTTAIDSGAKYICQGQSGEAMSLGPGSTRCRIYTFSIDSNLAGTGARDEITIGKGKELPAVAGSAL